MKEKLKEMPFTNIHFEEIKVKSHEQLIMFDFELYGIHFLTTFHKYTFSEKWLNGIKLVNRGGNSTLSDYEIGELIIFLKNQEEKLMNHLINQPEVRFQIMNFKKRNQLKE